MRSFIPLLLVTCLFCNAKSYSQKITGRVTDDDGAPIIGASVVVKGTKTGTTTNNRGDFSIEASAGNVLVFSSVSYETKEIPISSTSIIIKLSLQIKPLERLVASGNVVPVKKKADISSVTVLTAKELEAIPGFNIVQVLEGVVPGATVSSAGVQDFRTGEYFRSYLLIRGSPIKVYVDGIEYSESNWNYLGMVNKDNIEEIEILRGPSAAALYGSGAIGGVMLITTKKAGQNKTAVNVKTSFGYQRSDYTEKERQFQQFHNVEISHGFKNFGYVIGGNYSTQDDYLPKGSMNVKAAYGNFTYGVGKLKFTLNSNYNSNKINEHRYAIYDTVSSFGDFFWLYNDSAYLKANYRLQSATVALTTSFQATRWWTHNLTVGYSQNQFHYLTDASLYTDTTLIKYYQDRGTFVQTLDFASEDKTPSLRYNNVIKVGNADKGFKMDILSGFDYSHENYRTDIYYTLLAYSDSTGYAYSPHRGGSSPMKTKFSGTYLQLAPSYLDKYFLVAGVRYETSNLSAAALNPRVGFTTNFELSHFVIKPRINWGTSITPPPYQITHPGPSSATRILVANPDIKQKEQSGGEIAAEIYDKYNKLKMEVIRYDNIIKNDFYTKRTPVNNGASVLITYENIGKYAYKGWEFLAEYNISNFNIAANYSIINATYVDSFASRKTFYKGDRVDETPAYAAGASVTYTALKVFGRSDHLSATISMTSSGKMIAPDEYQLSIDWAKFATGNGQQPDYNNSFRETPAVTKFNLNVDYQFHRNVKFFIQAQNFTNNTTPDWDKSYPVPGASWLFGLKLNFENSSN